MKFSQAVAIFKIQTSPIAASNYSIRYVAGTVTIIPAQQTITAKPVFSLASGTYTSVQSVTISDATIGATIYYTSMEQSLLLIRQSIPKQSK